MKKPHIKPLIPLIRDIGGVLRKMSTSYLQSSETSGIISGVKRHFREAIPVISEVGADNPQLKSIVGVIFNFPEDIKYPFDNRIFIKL